MIKELELPINGIACLVQYTCDSLLEEIDILEVCEFDTGIPILLTTKIINDINEMIIYNHEEDIEINY